LVMSEEKFVIIGDGVAGATAAENIRERKEEAEIRVFTDDSEPLYNRIMLKTFMKGSLPKQYTRVHDEGWYESRDIELHLETKVADVDEEEKTVETLEGEAFEYDTLLMATGGNPREFPLDEGYGNVHYMWTMQKAKEIKEAAQEAEEAVVIGGGLLGIDLAVAFAENDAKTHYLIRESNWWHRGLEKEGAGIIHDQLEDLGVNVVTEAEASEFVGEDGRVEKVVTNSGEEFSCDEVAVAIGQTPNSGIVDVEKNGHDMIEVDENLQTSDEDIYAAGNMVEYYSPVFEERTVKGSWDHSEAMGEFAGKNMTDEETEFDYVNTYGVGHFNVQFLAIGDWTGEPVSKRYEGNHYRRLYFKGDRLTGAVMIGYTRGQEKIKEFIKEKEEFEDKEALLEKSYWE
jgi:NAD(P)H-nitrite reductase large subunit